MDIGVVTFLTDYGIAPVDLARAVEERGFDALFLTEHTHIPTSRRSPWPGGGELPRCYAHTFDPFIALTAMGCATERITLGTGVALVNQHHPINLAKRVASLVQIVGPRFVFGVGPGWNVEEMESHGITSGRPIAEMLDRVAAIRAIWTDEEAEHHGPFVDFEPLWSYPKPAQNPPVLIGGGGPKVLDRVFSHGDGWFPLAPAPEAMDDFAGRVTELRKRFADAGRERPPVTLYLAARDQDTLDAYAAAGADRALFELGDHGTDVDAALRELDELAAFTQKAS